jgi:hypothetical protein
MENVPILDLDFMEYGIPLPLFNIEIRTTGSRNGRSGSSRKCRYKASRGIVCPWGLFIYNITYNYY